MDTNDLSLNVANAYIGVIFSEEILKMKNIALIGYSGHAYVAFEIFFSYLLRRKIK